MAVRNDLCLWIDSFRKGESNTSLELDSPDNVLDTIASVKDQQERIMGLLSEEQEQLESELHIGSFSVRSLIFAVQFQFSWWIFTGQIGQVYRN